VWDGHLENQKNPDRLKRSIHVDRIGVHSTFVYIYAGLRALMICLFSFNMSFLLRKVEDMTTISKSQSLTSVSIKDCTLRVSNETTTLFLLRVIIKAIFIHKRIRDNVWVPNDVVATLFTRDRHFSFKDNPEIRTYKKDRGRVVFLGKMG